MTPRSDASAIAWSRARSATFDDGLLLTFPSRGAREEMQRVLAARARQVDELTLRLVK